MKAQSINTSTIRTPSTGWNTSPPAIVVAAALVAAWAAVSIARIVFKRA